MARSDLTEDRGGETMREGWFDFDDEDVVAAMQHIPGCDHDDMVSAIEAFLASRNRRTLTRPAEHDAAGVVEAICRAVCGVEGCDPDDDRYEDLAAGNDPVWTRYADAVAAALRAQEARPVTGKSRILSNNEDKSDTYNSHTGRSRTTAGCVCQPAFRVQALTGQASEPAWFINDQRYVPATALAERDDEIERLRARAEKAEAEVERVKQETVRLREALAFSDEHAAKVEALLEPHIEWHDTQPAREFNLSETGDA